MFLYPTAIRTAKDILFLYPSNGSVSDPSCVRKTNGKDKGKTKGKGKRMTNGSDKKEYRQHL
jgi:hypothetical protein